MNECNSMYCGVVVYVLGPLECMPDYNRVRAAMYWLRL